MTDPLHNAVLQALQARKLPPLNADPCNARYLEAERRMLERVWAMYAAGFDSNKQYLTAEQKEDMIQTFPNLRRRLRGFYDRFALSDQTGTILLPEGASLCYFFEKGDFKGPEPRIVLFLLQGNFFKDFVIQGHDADGIPKQAAPGCPVRDTIAGTLEYIGYIYLKGAKTILNDFGGLN